MNLTLDTIIIFVQNIDRLKTFYVDILGLEIVEEFDKEWLLLQAGACKIGLHKIPEVYLETEQHAFKFDNNTKIVFEVTDNLYSIREDFIHKNISLKEIKTFDNYDYLFCDGEDPEGNVFQLKQKKK